MMKIIISNIFTKLINLKFTLFIFYYYSIMDPSCISKTAGYTFNGGHVGGQAIYESVHSPLTGGGR